MTNPIELMARAKVYPGEWDKLPELHKVTLKVAAERDLAALKEHYAIVDRRAFRKELNEAIRRVMSIEIDAMDGDNLAVTICTYFNNPDQEVNDDYGWSDDAVDAYEAIEGAIRNLFKPVKAMIESGEV